MCRRACHQPTGRNWNSAQDYLGLSKTRVSISEGMKRINRCQPLLCQTAKSDCFQISGGDCMCVCVLALRGAEGEGHHNGGRSWLYDSTGTPASLVVTGDCTKVKYAVAAKLIFVKKKSPDRILKFLIWSQTSFMSNLDMAQTKLHAMQ